MMKNKFVIPVMLVTGLLLTGCTAATEEEPPPVGDTVIGDNDSGEELVNGLETDLDAEQVERAAAVAKLFLSGVVDETTSTPTLLEGIRLSAEAGLPSDIFEWIGSYTELNVQEDFYVNPQSTTANVPLTIVYADGTSNDMAIVDLWLVDGQWLVKDVGLGKGDSFFTGLEASYFAANVAAGG